MKCKLTRRGFIGSAAVSIIPPAIAMAQPKGGKMLSLFSEAQNSSANYDWKDAGVIDLTNSPYAKLKTVPVRAVTIDSGFWSKRRVTNVSSSIPTMRDQLLSHGRMDNFLRLTGKSQAPQKGPVFSDSDIYKWTEAVAFVLETKDEPQLRQATEQMIREVVATQEPSGYLNTYFVGDKKISG